MTNARNGATLRVLLVEDQRDLAASIWDYLDSRGHVVDHAVDGETGLNLVLQRDFDAVVLDLGLPGMDGLDLCRRLRAAGRGLPVLMLTARDTLDDKLRGFAEGADDYAVKPIAMKELEARLQVLHRRGKPLPDQPLQVGDLSYQPSTMSGRRGTRHFALTRGQVQILCALMQRAPSIASHEDLMLAVWGEQGGDQGALHTHIYGLRRLVDAEPDSPMIHSVHGIGYRLLATE